ncbi:unnamed protein product [Trichogramma brassicae]|uniref:Uncharacterized protein n=1 Tax=Trichogramma brassicae TaxID=86971 RepID=A0A6H5I1S6_9HYME|nr:unnamed protein product [Trichogramma brassicae]
MSELGEKYEDGEEDFYEEGEEFEDEDLDVILDAEQRKPNVPDDFEGVESYDGEHLYDFDDDDDHHDDGDSKRDAAVDTNETDKKQPGDPDSKTLRSVKSRKGRGGKKDDDATQQQQQKIKANEYVEYEEDVERVHDAGGADDKPGFMELIAKLQDVLVLECVFMLHFF